MIRARSVVAAYGAPPGDGSPQWCGPINLGDVESWLLDGRCLWSACVGWQPPMTRAHGFGGRGVPLCRRSLVKEHLQWLAAPNIGGPLDGGTARRVRSVAPGHSSPHWRGPTGWGDGEFGPSRWSLPVECLRGMAAPMAQAPQLGGWGVLELGRKEEEARTWLSRTACEEPEGRRENDKERGKEAHYGIHEVLVGGQRDPFEGRGFSAPCWGFCCGGTAKASSDPK